MWPTRNLNVFVGFMAIGFTLLSGCVVETIQPSPPTLTLDRESLIPTDQVKITPEIDIYPVRSETEEYEDPIPLPYPINTAGAEDSAFMMPDGNTLYVWFTPDASKPAEGQVGDGATGIYVFHKTSEGWSDAERILLQDPDEVSLDGCEFVRGDRMWFCSVREGYSGIHWFTAELRDGVWTNWHEAEVDPEYEVGELHITAGGQELYFHSSREGGQGGYDIWVLKWIDGEWGLPENVEIVNSPHTDGWPFISPDGQELWFTRGNGAPSLYRSKRVDGEWTEPVRMFSIFSGEASLDNQGNVYFTHHYYKDDVMLESDIYVAYKVTK